MSKSIFPPPEMADGDGLLAIGAKLETKTLLDAYSNGIFPWSVRPITWWSPDPRAIIVIDKFKLRKRMMRYYRNLDLSYTFNKDFEGVMLGCASPNPGRFSTWISDEFVKAYTKLHKEGYAHSVEAWQNKELAGGIYGVAIGGLFAAESMFYSVSNASTLCLYVLINHLKSRGYSLFDSQSITPHTSFLGAIEVSRADYLKMLKVAVTKDCSFL